MPRGSTSLEVEGAKPSAPDLLSWSTPHDHRDELLQLNSIWLRAARPLLCRPVVELSQHEFFSGKFRTYMMLKLNPQRVSMRVPFLRPSLLHATLVYVDSDVMIAEQVVQTVRNTVQTVAEALLPPDGVLWVTLGREPQGWNFAMDDNTADLCRTLQSLAKKIFVARGYEQLHERTLHASWL